MADQLNGALDELGYLDEFGLVRRGADLPPGAIHRVWTELSAKTGVEAAYFHGNTPLVAFASVDHAEDTQKVRRRLWNLSRVPVLIATTGSSTAAYSCLVPPGGSGQEDRGLLSATDAADRLPGLADFTREALEAGRPMSIYKKKFRRSERVDRHLLDNLRDLRQLLVESPDHRHQKVDSLLGRSIFIRYFEDRGILTAEHCEELCGVRTFEEALRGGVAKTFELFVALSDRFNGDLFRVDQEEPNWTTDSDLECIADFFGGTDVVSGQQALWPYDFSIIPPELISAIYEQLLEDRQSEDAAYYTPRPVVDLVLDEVLPWDGHAHPMRILDPACGSGIFLTEAFRRLLYQRFGSGSTDSSFAELVGLLTSSVFGIDINRDALRVAALGLYLALLEQLDPPHAWRDAHFPRLEDENLVEADFFENHVLVGEKFDVVVGNPPWKSALTPAARAFVQQQRMAIGDNQIAIAFLRRAEQCIGDEGRLGMLLPAKGLLHNRSNTTVAARFAMFTRWEIETIIDLTFLRRDLFTRAVAPSAVLIGSPVTRPDEPDRSSWEILHVVPRPSPLQSALDGFLISTDDVNVISSDLARTSSDVWKTYLHGKQSDLLLIQRLRASYPTLDQVAAERGWTSSQGLQIHGGDHYPADHLVGLPIIPYDAIHQFQLSHGSTSLFAGQFDTVQVATMHRPREDRLFRAPHLLIRRTVRDDRPAAVMLDFDAVFNNTVVGIAGPVEDLRLLSRAEAYLNSSLSRYYQLLTCSTWGVERSVIEENEILSMPFAYPSDDELYSIVETIREAPNELESRRNDLDKAVFEAFDISDIERDLINDTLWQFDKRTETLLTIEPDSTAVGDYAVTLSQTIAPVQESVMVDVKRVRGLLHYLVVTVNFDDASSEEASAAESVRQLLSASFDEAVSSGNSPVTFIQPSVIVLRDRAAYLLKPDQARGWTRSQAREDAGRILGAVVSLAREQIL